MTPLEFLRQVLEERLDARSRAWLEASSGEIAGGVGEARFCALFSLAARHARRVPLAPERAELTAAARALEGWNPERWTLLEALRAALLLARADLASVAGERAIAEAFRYADEGELCALYRSLALLPSPERFAWRAGEGCRTNMKSVFEAVALDTPYPARFFDDLAWNQVVIKCLFIGAPLWRLWGLDGRLSAELARMALDLADERRSAGREVPHELWLALGEHGGARALDSLEKEVVASNPNARGRRGAVYAFARAGAKGRLQALARSEADPLVRSAIADAIAGNTASAVFRALDLAS
jgi:hypothetical protein